MLAGFTGVQFDGRVVGTNHLFVPFTPPSSAARFLPDGYQLSQGRVFRIVVLNVRSRAVVFLLTAEGAPEGQFDAFLVKASRLLGSLRFPDQPS